MCQGTRGSGNGDVVVTWRRHRLDDDVERRKALEFVGHEDARLVATCDEIA